MGEHKTLGVYVDPEGELYEEFEQHKESGDYRSNSEALRDIMRSELQGDPATDGGQVLDELEQLRTEQQRATTTEKIENALIGVGLLVVAALAGGIGGPLVWVVAAVVATALIVLPFLPTEVFADA